MTYPEDYVDKIICGDCLDVMKDMTDDCVEMCLTDIPYGEVTRSDNGLRRLDKGAADVLAFDINVFMNELIRIARGSIYIFCAWEQISPILSIMKNYGLSIRSCIWEKTNPSPMNGKHIWLSSIEHCAYGKKSNAVFNESCRSSVWRFPNGSSKIHPTEKNLKLFEYIIKTSSNENDVIFDSCIGSGTTAVAAIRADRHFIGIDISEKYCAIARERIQQEIAQLKLDLGGGK